MGESAGREAITRETRRHQPKPREVRPVATAEPLNPVSQAPGLGSALAAAGKDARERVVDQLQRSRGNRTVQHLLAGGAAGGVTAGPAVQRDGDYPWSGPIVDAGTSLAWNIAGAIPGVGSISNFASLGLDAGKGGIDYLLGDEESASRRMHEVELDLLGMIPGVGSYLGGSSVAIDAHALGGRVGGASPEEAPLSGDLWHNMLERPASPYPENYGGSGSGAGGGGGDGGGGGSDGAGGAPGYYPEEQY